MKNFIEVGGSIDVIAPAGGFVSGQVVIIGALLGVATVTAAPGVSAAVKVGGVFEIPKVSAQAWTVGQEVSFDTTAFTATTVTSGTTTVIGYATEAAVNGSVTGRVKFYEHA